MKYNKNLLEKRKTKFKFILLFQKFLEKNQLLHDMQKEKKYKYTKEGQIETRIGCKIIKTKINFYEPRKKTNV